MISISVAFNFDLSYYNSTKVSHPYDNIGLLVHINLCSFRYYFVLNSFFAHCIVQFIEFYKSYILVFSTRAIKHHLQVLNCVYLLSSILV